MKITKAVFPVAGLGTRFLPATKASPKEMLPIVDKPLIQYAVEEAVAAGMTELIFITGRGKRAIEDHFDQAVELEEELEQRGSRRLLRMVRNIVPASVSCIYLRQPRALGLGHAILCAAPVVKDEPFAVVLADDLIDADVPVLRQMSSAFEQHQCPILAVENVARRQTRQYGIVKVGGRGGNLRQVVAIVEKPAPAAAPSTLAVVGRYILTADIFGHLRRIPAGSGGEIQLTDGIAGLIGERQVMAYRFDGVRYDCGDKLGYLKANVAYAMAHPEFGGAFKAYLRRLMKTRQERR
jgi:UTP--glucose-1-phosphate uridylyltransferase